MSVYGGFHGRFWRFHIVTYIWPRNSVRKLITTCALLVFFHAQGFAQNSAGGGIADIEYDVLAAVLGQESGSASAGWVMIAPFTATFECNPPAHNGLSFGACGGMRTQDQTPEEVLAQVRKAIPSVSADLATDLIRKSQQSVQITRTLPISAKQFVVNLSGATKPPFQGNPAVAFYPSRVGLNADGDRALVYAGVINWADAKRSLGRFTYLERSNHQWTIKDSLTVWSLVPKSSGS